MTNYDENDEKFWVNIGKSVMKLGWDIGGTFLGNMVGNQVKQGIIWVKYGEI